MKKFIAIMVVWAVVLGGGAAAYKFLVLDAENKGGSSDTGKQVASKPGGPTSNLPKIRMAIDGFSGYFVFRTPEFKAKLAAQGLDFEWKDDGAVYKDRMQTVKSGETPLAVFTIDSLLGQTRYDEDPPATIVMLIDETRGADAMIGYASGVKDIDALNSAQAKIVMVPDSPSEALTRVVRHHFNLPDLPIQKEKYMIPITTKGGVGDVYAAFQNAKPTEKKAFVMWEPFVSQAIKEYGKDGAQI